MRSLEKLALVVVCVALASCGSGMTSGVIRSPDFQKYRPDRHSPATPADRIELLTKTPNSAHAVVGTIEIRTSRPKSAEELLAELRRNGRRLEADAVVPPPLEQPRRVAAGARLSPVYPFFVFDDGRTQVIEAQAIRFPPAP